MNYMFGGFGGKEPDDSFTIYLTNKTWGQYAS